MQLARRTAEPAVEQIAVVERPVLQADDAFERMFMEVYERVHDRAIDHAQRFLDKDEARDAFHAAMSDIWQRWKKLQPEQRSEAYCLGAVHRQAIKHARRNRRFVSDHEVEEELAELVVGEIEAITRATTAADVLDATINSMPMRRREVLLLIHHFRFTYMEVAELLGLSLGTVKTHLRLACNDVRAAFRDRGFRLAQGDVPRLLPGTEEATNV